MEIRNLSKHMKEVYYKPVRVGNFWSNNYIEYDDRNKTLSVEEYLNKTRPYLKDIIYDLRKFHSWKIQLMITITLCVLKITMKSV